MIHRVCGEISADYYTLEEEIPSNFSIEGTYYIFVDSTSDDVERINSLLAQGFSFHDRTILTIIEIRRLQENLQRLVRYDIEECKHIPDELVDIALKAYPTDRRFHFEAKYNQEKAEKRIAAYLEELSSDSKSLSIYVCKHNGKLIGYSILKELSEGIYENLLGAVAPEYRSRGGAFSLYGGMLLSMRDKGYKEYHGWISTKNVASLNLHVALGGKFSMTKDRYIKRKSEQ